MLGAIRIDVHVKTKHIMRMMYTKCIIYMMWCHTVNNNNRIYKYTFYKTINIFN